VYTNSRAMTIAGLVPGSTYMLQTRAVGGSTGYSDWSNPHPEHDIKCLCTE
jgi:hypothetical protein